MFNISQLLPNYVNFTQLKVGISATAVVIVSNTFPNQSLHFISLQTSSFTLLFKLLAVGILELQQVTEITLVLVSNKVGHIKADLYATKYPVLAKCEVHGFSTPSKYGSRLLKTKRLNFSKKIWFTFTFSDPHLFSFELSQLTLSASGAVLNGENQILFLSLESSFLSKHNPLSVPNSITLAGHCRSRPHSLAFSSIEPKTLKPLASGLISSDLLLYDHALIENLFIFLPRQFFLEPIVPPSPVQMHFDDSTVFTMQEFDVYRCFLSLRLSHLTTLNKMIAPSILHAKSTNGIRCFGLSYNHVLPPASAVEKFDVFGNICVEIDGQPPTVIPYLTPAWKESLQLGHQRLSFFCGSLAQFLDRDIWRYQLPKASAGILESQVVHNGLTNVDPTAVKLHDTGEPFTSHVEPIQLMGAKLVKLEHKKTSLIVSYYGSLEFQEILNVDAASNLDRVLYSGLELANIKDISATSLVERHWFASSLFIFTAEEDVKTKSRSIIDFLPVLHYLTSPFTQFQNTWRSLLRHIHAATLGVALVAAEPIEHCHVPGRLALNLATGDDKIPIAGNVVTDVVWPRILSEHLSVDQASSCHLNVNFGSTEGLSQLRIHSRVTEAVSCRLTLNNPTDKPLLIQHILLDDLIPVSMNYSEMVIQMPILSEQLLQAAHIPQHLTKVPLHPSQRKGRFISHFEALRYEGEALESMLSIMPGNHLQSFVSPASCPIYTLPPRGGEVNYSITFSPGAFHNESTGQFQPKFDSSLVLLRNNLTALEALVLQAVTQTASLGIRSGLLSTESSASRVEETSERSLTTFPTATGFAFDASVSYNPSLTNAGCESTPLAGSVDVARYDLFSENGKALCPVTVTSENLSLCKVSATFLNTSLLDGPLYFTFHEGYLRSLCSDGAVRPRPSITHFLEGLKSAFPFNLIRLFTNSQISVPPKMETSRFASKLQIAWAVDEDNMPIFSSEFISGLILSRRIALFNPGSLPVWIVRVGFRRPNSTRHAAALEQCDPHLSGFSVALCDADGSTASSRDRPKMVDEAMGVFELKPDEQRWLEVLYTPDFLHSEINVELCLFVSLRSPTAERSVRLGKGIIDLDPNRGDRGSQSVSSFFTCNESSVSDCSLFQPDPIRLTAKISPSLAYLCYSSLLRPDFEANLWSLLLFVFASNLAGIFVVASFDAVRMLAFHESCRQLLLPTASSINTSEIEQQGSPSLLAPQLLNLPLVGQNQQQENSALPYLRALGNTIVQPFSDDNTNNRRRTHRPSVSKVSITNAIGKFAKSLTRSLRNGAIRASKTVYGPVSRSVWAPGKHFSSLFTSYWGQAGESGRSAPRKLVKSTAEASSIIRSQTQSRKVGTDNSEIINVAILASRRSSDDIKRTPKQSNTKFGGELTSTSANVTQASVDGEGATLCTSQSSNGNCLKSRVNGAKQNSVVVSPSEWAISSKSASGSTLAMNGALKKHLLSVPSVSTTPSSPKMRVSRPAAQRSPTPPPLPPPPPSLIMESIRVESASMGVKKPKQFVPQQQSSSQQFTCKPVSTLPQPQGFTKLVNNRNGCIKETLSVKQKSPSVSTYDSVESSAQRKKSEKKVTALPKQPNPIVLPAPVIPAWQPRKAWTSVELSETPQSTVNESSRFGLPLTSAWTATSRLTESDVNEPSGKIRPGDLEFPPLGTVPSKRPMRTSLDDEESSCLAVDTSEYDTQIRYLPSTSTTASGHHFRYTGNCHDISPRSQQQQQYSFQNRFTAPHIATPPLHRSNFVITNTQVARRHRTRLCNPSISMTTLLNPQSFSGSYLTQFATSANAFSSNFTAGYVKQDFVPMRQHVYEPLTGTCDGVHINLHGHRRRRSSTGQIFSDGFSPNTGITGNHESTDLMFHSSHKSAMDLSTILPKKEEENANDLYSPEWINAFDTPPPKDVEVSISGSTPPCELQQLTETRFKCMLMHERRGRMSSEVESELSILKDMSIVDSEEYVPPNLLNDLTPDDPFSGNEYRQTGFNKTMGGQLSNTERSPPTVSLTGTIQEIPDAFDVFQKTWLPAFLPWRSRFPVEDPTGDQDLVEPTLYLTLRSDVSGSIIQEPSESTTMTDGKAKGQLITNTDEKLPIHDVGLHE